MSNPTLVLWCDATRNRLIQGWQTSQLATKPVLKQGDSIGVELHWVSFNGTGLMQEVVFPPSSNVTLAIGKIDEMPTGGAFTLSYNGDTTVSLANNATATEIAAALNDLASITAEGGVTVERVGITNRIVWNDPGAYTSDLTCDPDGLSPTTNSSIIQLREGTTAIRRIILFSLKQAPIAACTTFTTSASPTLTISSIYTKTWRIKLNGQPKGGSFKVVFQVGTTTYKTDPLSLFASSSDIAIALNTMLSSTSSNFTTVSSDSGVWDVTAPASVTMADSTTGSVVAMSVESDIIPFSSLYGLLDMNTANVEEFLSGSSTKDAILEIEIDMSGEIQTIAQTPVTLINDIISQSVFELVSMGQVMPVDSVVRWDTPQNISSAGKLQARQNIDAVDSSAIAALQAADIAMDGRIDVVEGYLDQQVKTTSDVDFKSVSVSSTTGNAFEYMPSGDGYKVWVSSTGSLNGKVVSGGVDTATWSVNGTDGFIYNVGGVMKCKMTSSGLTLGTGTTITFPDLSTLSSASTSNYLQKTSNLSDLASASAARTNLGLGTMATETASNYMTRANNLSDIFNPSSARTNIGLGSTSTPTFNGVNVSTNVSLNTTRLSVANGSTTSTFGSGGMSIAGGDGAYAEVTNGAGVSAQLGGVGPGTYGIWVGTNLSSWCGINANGVVFSDGTTQTTAAITPTRLIDLTAYGWKDSYLIPNRTDVKSRVKQIICGNPSAEDRIGAYVDMGPYFDATTFDLDGVEIYMSFRLTGTPTGTGFQRFGIYEDVSATIPNKPYFAFRYDSSGWSVDYYSDSGAQNYALGSFYPTNNKVKLVFTGTGNSNNGSVSVYGSENNYTNLLFTVDNITYWDTKHVLGCDSLLPASSSSLITELWNCFATLRL